MRLLVVGCVLRLGLKLDGRVVLDRLLNRDFNELVEGVELLSHETFVGKVRVNHQPARLIPVALGERQLGVIVIHGNCVRCEWDRLSHAARRTR